MTLKLNVGALIIIGFGGILYYSITRNPQNSIGNYRLIKLKAPILGACGFSSVEALRPTAEA